MSDLNPSRREFQKGGFISGEGLKILWNSESILKPTGRGTTSSIIIRFSDLGHIQISDEKIIPANPSLRIFHVLKLSRRGSEQVGPCPICGCFDLGIANNYKLNKLSKIVCLNCGSDWNEFF